MSLTETARDDSAVSPASGEEDAGLAILAERLIRRLGVEDALRMCRENSWHGVLRFIQGRKNDGIHI